MTERKYEIYDRIFKFVVSVVKRIEGKKQLRAFADISVNGEITINSVRLMEDDKGFWLGLPQMPYESQGKTKYSSIVEMAEGLKKQVKEAVSAAYNDNR